MDSDLRKLRQFFDPISSGRKIREALSKVGPTDVDNALLQEPLTLGIDPTRRLITIEGRLLLGLLESKLLNEGDAFILTAGEFHQLQNVLVTNYRDWTLQRLRSVVALQEGEGAPLLPQAVGAILFLLVNDSTSEERAVTRPARREDFQELDRAIQEIISAFADAYAPPEEKRARRTDQYSLYGGYALTEAKRRLGAQLVSREGKLFIEQGAEDRAVERVAQELRRRSDNGADRALNSFDALVKAYREHRPVLAAFRSAFERPAHTQTVRHVLERLLEPSGEEFSSESDSTEES